MPIYEFRCGKCGKEFEERRLFSESDKSAKCPHCGGAGEKLISGFGFKFGFYTRPSDKPLRVKESTWGGAGEAKAKGSAKPAAGTSRKSKATGRAASKGAAKRGKRGK